jgi:hypothetical protein
MQTTAHVAQIGLPVRSGSLFRKDIAVPTSAPHAVNMIGATLVSAICHAKNAM